MPADNEVKHSVPLGSKVDITGGQFERDDVVELLEKVLKKQEELDKHRKIVNHGTNFKYVCFKTPNYCDILLILWLIIFH